MRKNSHFLLGTAAGICLTLLVTGPQAAQLVAVAKAAVGADTYSQLTCLVKCLSVSGPTMSKSPMIPS